MLKEFQKSFLQWCDQFGIKEYRYLFLTRTFTDDVRASLDVDQSTKVACVTLDSRVVNEDEIEEFAKHEAIHLLVNKLFDVALKRYVTEDEICKEEETLVRILERLIV